MVLLEMSVGGTWASWNRRSMHMSESEKLEMERTGRTTGRAATLA